MQPTQELWSEYGQACVQLEIAQNKHMEIKKKIADTLNQPEPKPAE